MLLPRKQLRLNNQVKKYISYNGTQSNLRAFLLYKFHRYVRLVQNVYTYFTFCMWLILSNSHRRYSRSFSVTVFALVKRRVGRVVNVSVPVAVNVVHAVCPYAALWVICVPIYNALALTTGMLSRFVAHLRLCERTYS